MGTSNKDIAHHWANQVKNRRGDIAGTGSNFFYEGGKLYSYGKHFCVARILPSGTVVMGNHTYSPSTGRHQSYARMAVYGKRIVYCHDPDASAMSNMTDARLRMKTVLEDAAKARRNKERASFSARWQAMQIAQQANEYLKALPVSESERVFDIDIAYLHLTPEEMQRWEELNAADEARKRERQDKRDAQARLAAADRLLLWRGHEFNGYLGTLSPALRLSKKRDEVQTSWGANIPVAHAKRLWPLIVNCKGVGKPVTPHRGFPLGVYKLEEIRADGSIKVGCHTIAYSEIEGIAHQLGLLNEKEEA